MNLLRSQLRYQRSVRWLPLLTCISLLVGCAGARRDQHYGDLFITTDTIWSGAITIAGRVTVQRGSTLTIMPGTVIAFERHDIDGDGVGDAQLVVMGHLDAAGNAQRPITFTSAAANPVPADWKFLYIEQDKNLVIDYCIFEYGFNGVQFHYATGRLENSIIRFCREGVRFSTAHVLIRNNRITDNGIGVRFEGRGAKTIITGNLITNNQVGIFVALASDKQVTISGNNIYNNSKYNLRMGNKQNRDIVAVRNWWGDKDPSKAYETIFDGHLDPELGQVEYLPVLAAPKGLLLPELLQASP